MDGGKANMKEGKRNPPVYLYAVTIHNSAASGRLREMKRVAAQAEQHLKNHGDVSAALEALKIEIAKLERRP
jgi:HPt (histidine-containing phosphotransfer) domain-containing protein